MTKVAREFVKLLWLMARYSPIVLIVLLGFWLMNQPDTLAVLIGMLIVIATAGAVTVVLVDRYKDEFKPKDKDAQ